MQVELTENPKLINDLEFLRKLSTMKVLVVDDQRNMVKTIENMLASICAFKRKSNSVLRANDGHEALTHILNQPPALEHHIDLILLDWNMPRLPGIEVVRTIRNAPEQFINKVPVIMITGESQSRDVNNALYEGVDNYLLKPFLLDDLRTRMNPILRNYWSGQKMRRAKNRRCEPRYDGRRLKMQVEIEFMDGTRKTGDVVSISHHGARAELETPDNFGIKGFYFPPRDGMDVSGCRLDCVAFIPEVEGKPPRVGIPLWLKFGFPSGEAEARWLAWVEEAARQEREYRDSLI